MALPTPEVTELPEEVKRARDAAARRASLRATPTATAAPPTAPVASAAPEAAKAGGWFRRTANALRSGATAAGEVATAAPSKMAALPGQILNADLGAAAKGALRAGEGAAKTVGGALTGPMARAAAPIAAITSAAGSYGTDTDTYAQRTGIERGASDWTGKGADAGSRLRFDAVKDAGIRVLGTAQDLGNTLTFGLADRVGNALAGNGFNRSAGNQVGEVFGRGSEVGDNQPPATAAPAAPAAPTASAVNPNYGNEHLRGPVASQPPTNVVTRTGNSFSGTDIKPGFTYANGSQGKGTVTSLDTSEGHRQNLLELQRNAAGRAAAPAPSVAGGFGGGGTSERDTRNAKMQEESDLYNLMRSGLSARQAAGVIQQRKQTQQQGEIARMQNAAAVAGNANQLRVAEMNNATQRENNAATTRTALRGHELDFERGMAPIRFQQQQRAQIADLLKSTNGDPAAAAQQALAAGRVDLAETLSKPVATMQGEAEKRDGLIENKRKEIAAGVKGAFNHMDKDGQPKMSEALEAQAIARFMRANPDFHKEGDPVKRQQLLDDALGDEELMARFSKPTSGGWASLVPNFISGNKPMLRQDNIPNAELLAKGKISGAIGGVRGALSPDAEKGDRFFDPGDGYEAVNMGDLSARALARLEKHRKEAAERLRK